MIKPLLTDLTTPDCVPSRKKLMDKLNEVIAEINIVMENNKQDSLPISTPVQEAQATVAPLSFEGYTPIGGIANALYFMPPAVVGHVESDGTVIQGMVARNRLPAHVLNYFNTLSTNG